MKVRTTILMGTALMLAPLFSLQAQIPRTLSYQGLVTDATGAAKPDGSYTFTFRLYDVASGGTALWTESKTISVKDGLFSTALGDQTLFPASLVFDRPYWLGIQVGIEIELSPLTPLTSVGYSFQALRADTADYAFSAPAGNITTDQLADNAVTSAKIADGTIIGADISTEAGLNIDHLTSTKIDVYTTDYGFSGRFILENASSSATAFKATTDGTGEAGKFYASNSSNSANAVEIKNWGTGNALYVKTYISDYACYFDGDVYVTGNLTEGSDIRWKRNIVTLESMLDKVLSLRGVKFEWNLDDYPDKSFREGSQIGFIAQEVEEVLPELVKTDQDGYKSVNYQKITAVLVEAIKEQQKEIEELKAAITALQDQSDVSLQE